MTAPWNFPGFSAWARRWRWTFHQVTGRVSALLRNRGIKGLANAVLQRIRPISGRSTAVRPPESEPPSLPEIQAEIGAWRWKPQFSIFLLGPAAEEFRQTLDSIHGQLYPHFEVFIGADQDFPGAPGQSLKTLENSDLAAALQVAKGDQMAFIQSGVSLAPELLLEVARLLQTRPDLDFIYTDHDLVRPGSDRREAQLKPDWSPDFLLCKDYTGEAKFFSRLALERMGAGSLSMQTPRLGYQLSLALSTAQPIVAHIPRVLYRQSEAPERPAPEGIAGLPVATTPLPGRADLRIPHFPPLEDELVSIIICTHDQPDFLDACLSSVFRLTRSANFEVVLVDHQSRLAATRAMLQKWKSAEPARFRVEPVQGPFNYSAFNNAGVKVSRGQTILLLNNDTEVISPDWITTMAGWARRPQTGAVGACLLYPNQTIQHAGILLGMRDLAVHAFKGLPANSPGYQDRLLVPSNFLALTGACLMVRRALYEELNGLDEQFAVAGGDIDFCLRLYQRGLFNVLLPQVRLFHYESATRGFEDNPEKWARLQQEYALLRNRWPEYVDADPFYHPAFNRLRGDFSN